MAKSSSLKILFISGNFPIKPEKNAHGIFKRMELFMETLNEIGEISILFFVPSRRYISKKSLRYYKEALTRRWGFNFKLTLVPKLVVENRWRKFDEYFAGMIDFFKQKKFIFNSGHDQLTSIAAELTKNPDIIFVHRLSAMAPLLKIKRKKPAIFFDLDDIEHISFFRELRLPPHWPSKKLFYFHVPALFWGEWKAIRRSRRVFVCSDKDKLYLENRWNHKGIVNIPNAVEMPNDGGFTKAPTLLFLGSYKYQPNITAANFLIEKVWPIVHSRVPAARLIIAGDWPENIKYFRDEHPGIEFPGFIKDLDQIYKNTRVVCSPIFAGGGTRFKIIEAAAYKKPVVSTTLGAEGLDLTDGAQILIRDDPQAFADGCVALLKDDAKCKEMGLAARAIIQRKFDKKIIIQQIKSEILRNF